MKLLCEREETAEQITIKFKYYAALWILLLLVFVFSFTGQYFGVSEQNGFRIGMGMLVILFLLSLEGQKLNREIKIAMKTGKKVEISGSKFSFSNPIIYKITK